MICTKCQSDLSENDFYRRRRGYDEFQPWCKGCIDASTRNRQVENKKKAVDLMGGKCSRCGYCKCIKALEFHHHNPENKDRTSKGAMASRSWKRYWLEISKCILLCSNCHREEEENLRTYGAANSAALS